ncbi:MAG TPA: hypothetical protein VEB21_04910, partial [Terriglobales bacterium]|nr:hypothetical protein [Terriglobales bacterium]
SKESFLGIPQIQSILLPVSVPELVLYKAQEQDGFAKIEIAVSDAASGGLVHHSGPARATTYARHRQILFFGWYRTDTTRNTKD